MKHLALFFIKIYQLVISPWFGDRCRFYPSCSCYAKHAINKYGLIKGMWLSGLRIIKCHPFHAGGYDPVPGESTI